MSANLDYSIVSSRSVVLRGKPVKNLLLCKDGDTLFIREVNVDTGHGVNKFGDELSIKKMWSTYNG